MARLETPAEYKRQGAIWLGDAVIKEALRAARYYFGDRDFALSQDGDTITITLAEYQLKGEWTFDLLPTDRLYYEP